MLTIHDIDELLFRVHKRLGRIEFFTLFHIEDTVSLPGYIFDGEPVVVSELVGYLVDVRRDFHKLICHRVS